MYGTKTSQPKEETRGAFGWDHIASFDSHEQGLPNSFCQVLNTLYSQDQSYDARVTRGGRDDRYGSGACINAGACINVEAKGSRIARTVTHTLV